MIRTHTWADECWFRFTFTFGSCALVYGLALCVLFCSSLLTLFRSCVLHVCCTRFSFFTTTPTSPRDWLGRMSPKRPILCRVGRKTLTQSVSRSINPVQSVSSCRLSSFIAHCCSDCCNVCQLLECSCVWTSASEDFLFCSLLLLLLLLLWTKWNGARSKRVDFIAGEGSLRRHAYYYYYISRES